MNCVEVEMRAAVEDPVFEIAPEDHLDRLLSLWRKARVGGRSLELYQRSSFVHRIARRSDGTSPEFHAGKVDGTAVRVRHPIARRVAFAATSGLEAHSVTRAVERALAGHGAHDFDAPWPSRRAVTMIDRDDRVGLPPLATLAGWLDDAWARFDGGRGRGARAFRPREAWVEVASTIECWVGPAFRAFRSRSRAWAAVTPTANGHSSPGPVTIAARHWTDLRPEAWLEIAEDRAWPHDGRDAPAATGRVSVVFGPEAAARLVQALVTAIHTPDHGPGLTVGPGWRLADDPRESGSLFGATFDDCCFPTRRRRLADGNRVTARPAGPGCYRRPSFREPPLRAPSSLVLDAPAAEPPPSAVLAAALDVHPVSAGDWTLAFSGGFLKRREPGPAIRSGFIRTTPADLIRCCVGAVGPVRESFLGIRTAALLFDGLEVRV